jgi:chromosome segregation ATPase
MSEPPNQNGSSGKNLKSGSKIWDFLIYTVLLLNLGLFAAPAVTLYTSLRTQRTAEDLRIEAQQYHVEIDELKAERKVLESTNQELHSTISDASKTRKLMLRDLDAHTKLQDKSQTLRAKQEQTLITLGNLLERKKALSETVSNLETSELILKQSKRRLRDEVSNLEAQRKGLSFNLENLIDKRTELKNLELKLGDAAKDLKISKDAYGLEEKRHGKIKTEADELQKEKAKVTDETDSLKRTVSGLQTELAKLEAKREILDKLNSDIAKKEAKLNELGAQLEIISTRNTKIGERTIRDETRAKEAQDRVDNLAQKQIEADQKLNETKNSIVSVETELQRKKNELSEVLAAIKGLTKEREIAKNLLHVKDQQAGEIDEKLREINARKRTLESDLAGLQARREEARRLELKRDQLNSEVQGLETQRQKAETARTSVEEQLQKREKRLAHVEAKVEGQDRKLSDTQLKLAKRSEKLAVVEEQIRNIQKNNSIALASQEAELRSANVKLLETQAEAESRKAELQVLRQNIAELQAELGNRKPEQSRMITEGTEARVALKKVNKEVSEKKQKLFRITTEIDKHRTQIDVLRDQAKYWEEQAKKNQRYNQSQLRLIKTKGTARTRITSAIQPVALEPIPVPNEPPKGLKEKSTDES